MNLTIVFVVAAVLVFLVVPVNGAAFVVLFAATIWLLREAHLRRAAGQAFGPGFRAMLWAAAVFSGLVGTGAGALSAVVLMDRNPAWGGVLLLFTVPLCLLGLASVFAFGWYARCNPIADASAKPDG